MNLNLEKNAILLINDEQNGFRSIKTIAETRERLIANGSNVRMKNSTSVSRTGEKFQDEITNYKNRLKQIKEKRTKQPLLASLIDTLNVINSLNKTSQSNSSSVNACNAAKCALNCELQDQLNNGKFEKSGFCKTINFCQCCTLKHESCLAVQRRCKAIGLKAICNGNGHCSGNCTCTMNSCLQYCISRHRNRSNVSPRSSINEGKLLFIFLF